MRRHRGGLLQFLLLDSIFELIAGELDEQVTLFDGRPLVYDAYEGRAPLHLALDVHRVGGF